MTLFGNLISYHILRRNSLELIIIDEINNSLIKLFYNLLLNYCNTLLNFSKRNSLLVHELHVVVHGVGVQRHRHAQVAEVAHALAGPTVVHHVAVQHEQDDVELEEDLGGGLVDGGDDGATSIGQSVQEPNQVESSGGVQSSCGLVEEDQRRVDQELHSDRCALLLASRQTSDQAVPHVCLGSFLQSKRVDHALHQRVLLFAGLERQPHVGDEAEGLPGREGRQHEVLLHDVADHALVVGHRLNLLAVDLDGAAQFEVLREQSS